MKVLDGGQTAALLPYPALVAALRATLGDPAAVAPPRLAVALPGGGTLLVMPAADAAVAVTKVVTVHPGNASDIPTVQADVLALDARTGERLALLDGATVTARRTAAVSLLAALDLARRPDGPLLVVGAGALGRAHVEALVGALGTSRVTVCSRTRPSAEALAGFARDLGAQADAVDDPAGPLVEATVVVTATTSATPVLPDAVREDAFVAAVGAFTADTAELPGALVTRAELWVDTLEGARQEAGDLLLAGVDFGTVRELGPAQRPARDSGPVVFKGVGHALWDLAAARVALGVS